MSWKILLAMMVTFALMMSSSYTMLIPFLPIYMQNELGATADNVSLWSGVTYAITFAISAFVSPIWGKLSDKMGKKPMIIRASFLLAITYFLGGIVRTPFELFFVRAFQGIASGLWPACLVMMSACVPKNKLGISMGLMQSANICGGIIGPLLGGILATAFGMRNSFYVGAVALSLITVTTILFIKEPPVAPEKEINKAQNTSYLSFIKDKNILILLLCVCMTNLVILQIQPIVSLYVQQLSHNSDKAVLLTGFIMSLGGIAGALASPLWGKTGQKVGFYKTITLAFISAGLLMSLQGVPNSLVLFGLMQFLCGLGFSGIFPSANSILVLLTPPSSRGMGFGSLFSAQMIGGALGPVIGGVIVSFMSFNSVYIISGSILFIIGIYLKFFAPESFKQKASLTKDHKIESRNKEYLDDIKKKAQAELIDEREKAK
ncbi:MAG: MFS transporter [Succinivibrio sp.]|nr:MFS transporter [Succinivibrio sp.]MCI7253643.1 MFS transporter [Succinatimonas sp.]MDD6377187.1 MFS transporter [Succinatimonas sp.]